MPEPPRALWREATAYRELRALRRSRVYAGRGVAHGYGQPVLLIPGFLTPDRGVATLAGWLRRTGHYPARARNGINVACGEWAVARLARRLETIAHRRGQRVAIVAHSRGGHFARVLAVRRPDLVSGIVTLGTPTLESASVHPLVRGPAVAVALLGAAGVPHVFRPSCFLGECCRGFRADLAGAFPERVGYVEVVSRADGVVNPDAVGDPCAERVEVTATHLGFLFNAGAYETIAEALAGFRTTVRV